MKTIFVATDFSGNAGNALRFAGSLAAQSKAEILLFNAYQIPVHAANARISAAGVDDLLKANKGRLARLAQEVVREFGVPVKAQTKLAELSEALEELVIHEKADLVIMGAHANDWSDQLFGNNTTAVIRKATYPVLIVPPGASFKEVKKILYAFDGNRHIAPETLAVLAEVADRFKAEVQVFHVVTPNKTAAKSADPYNACPGVEEALRNVPHGYKDAEEPQVIEGIEKEIQRFEANLLVMVPHQLNMWESLFNQSVTRSMALRTHIPLLVLPAAREVRPAPLPAAN